MYATGKLFSWLCHQELAFLKGAACTLRGKACVGDGFVALQMPHSQGHSRCPANLVWFSSVNQLSAREACLSQVRPHLRALITWQAAGEPDLILLSVWLRPWVRNALGGWGAEPAYSTCFRVVERAQLKLKWITDPSSVQRLSTPKRGTAYYLVFTYYLDYQRSLTFFFFLNETRMLFHKDPISYLGFVTPGMT